MKYLLIFILGICITGCVSAKYTGRNGESLTYSRLGTQKITGLKIARDENGTMQFELESQEGTAGDLAETMKNISAALVKLP